MMQSAIIALVVASFGLSVCFGRIDRLQQMHGACELQLTQVNEERASRRGRRHRLEEEAALLRSRVATLESDNSALRAAAAEKDLEADRLRKSQLELAAALKSLVAHTLALVGTTTSGATPTALWTSAYACGGSQTR